MGILRVGAFDREGDALEAGGQAIRASLVGVMLAVAHVAEGVADRAGFRGPLLRFAQGRQTGEDARQYTSQGRTLTLLWTARTPSGCQRLMKAIQKGESEVGVCCEGRTIRHGAHRRGG
jgi:hypothetical protein